MPVYHLVFHTFGSWMADHPDGYQNRKINRRVAANAGLANYHRTVSHREEIHLTADQQKLLLRTLRGWNNNKPHHIHAAAVVDTHLHVIASWKTDDSASMVIAEMKQFLTHILNQSISKKSGRWFSRGAGKNRIRDYEHLLALVKQYIPDHGDHIWIEEGVYVKLFGGG